MWRTWVLRESISSRMQLNMDCKWNAIIAESAICRLYEYLSSNTMILCVRSTFIFIPTAVSDVLQATLPLPIDMYGTFRIMTNWICNMILLNRLCLIWMRRSVFKIKVRIEKSNVWFKYLDAWRSIISACTYGCEDINILYLYSFVVA